MKSVIQKYKSLIKKLRNKELERMFLDVDFELAINTRNNMRRSRSILLNQIYNGGASDSIHEIETIINKKKIEISELFQKKIENKKAIKEIHKQLSNLL